MSAEYPDGTGHVGEHAPGTLDCHETLITKARNYGGGSRNDVALRVAVFVRYELDSCASLRPKSDDPRRKIQIAT